MHLKDLKQELIHLGVGSSNPPKYAHDPNQTVHFVLWYLKNKVVKN